MIELEGIHRYFKVGDQEVHALDDVNLKIDDGEYVSIMGPSGSGKSTLLNLLGLLDTPTSGIYRLGGRDTTTLSAVEKAALRSQNIGFVFQFFHLVPRLTAAENVELPMMLVGIPPRERHKRVADALAGMGLSGRAHHHPEQLSGGERQRVAIARATIMRPSVLLADEPTGNLDSQSGREVIEILEQLNEQAISLIVVTHDAAMGRRARRRLQMLDGRIESDLRDPA